MGLVAALSALAAGWQSPTAMTARGGVPSCARLASASAQGPKSSRAGMEMHGWPGMRSARRLAPISKARATGAGQRSDRMYTRLDLPSNR